MYKTLKKNYIYVRINNARIKTSDATGHKIIKHSKYVFHSSLFKQKVLEQAKKL